MTANAANSVNTNKNINIDAMALDKEAEEILMDFALRRLAQKAAKAATKSGTAQLSGGVGVGVGAAALGAPIEVSIAAGVLAYFGINAFLWYKEEQATEEAAKPKQ